MDHGDGLIDSCDFSNAQSLASHELLELFLGDYAWEGRSKGLQKIMQTDTRSILELFETTTDMEKSAVINVENLNPLKGG